MTGSVARSRPDRGDHGEERGDRGGDATGGAPEHARWMARAVALGRRGWGRVEPNPMVGCVVVREGRAVGEGWHREFGGAHAEVHALEAAGDSARGATVYVSLEPCSHRGKTPACTDALRRAGVARVVYGAADPTTEAGGGARLLAEGGIDVVGPLTGAAEARRQNPSFFHRARKDTPWVAVKLAVSLDGGIAAGPGERTRLTGPEASGPVHTLRSGFDGIVVGVGTVLVDDPLLTVREGVTARRPPTRIVLDGAARTPPDAALFRDVADAPVVIFTGRDAPEDALERLEQSGAAVHPVGATDGRLHLEDVLRVCREIGLGSLLVEGGGRLVRSFAEADRVERLHLFLAPRLLGEGAVPAFPGRVPPVAGRMAAHWDPAAPPALHGRDVEAVWDRVRPWSHGDAPAAPSDPPAAPLPHQES